MQGTYIDEAPVAEIRDGVVWITIGDGLHPPVCAPVSAVRKFCEVTIRGISAWEREQAKRVLPFRKRRKAAPPAHG